MNLANHPIRISQFRISAILYKLRLLFVPMAKPGKLQTFLEYWAAKSVLTGLGILPARAAIATGRAMGGVFYVLAGDLRRTAAINLKLAFPEKSDEERSVLVRECFASLG